MGSDPLKIVVSPVAPRPGEMIVVTDVDKSELVTGIKSLPSCPPAPAMPECVMELVRSARNMTYWPCICGGGVHCEACAAKRAIAAVEAHYAKEVR